MTLRRLLIASAAVASLLGASSTHAQDADSRRMDQLEKQVRELRAIVFQGRDTGQPVEVRPAGPDPAVTALEGRVQALEDTQRQTRGQLEELSHNVDEARASAASLRDQGGELRGQLDDLKARVAKLEAQLAPGAGAAAIPPPPTGDIPPPPTTTPAAPPQDATAAAQASDTGRLGGPSSAPTPQASAPAAPASPTAAYKAARAQLSAGDYAGAANGFQDYLSKYPNARNAPEAYYWLGESDYAREDYQDATPAYARALKGWPKLPWAPDATVKLARALAETDRSAEACAALSEYDHRYRSSASSTVRARADAVRTRAKCGA